MQRNERFDRLQEAVNTLSGDYRQVVLLARIEGLSMKQVGERMNRSPDAVKKLFGRALRKLRTQLSDSGSLYLPDRRLSADGGDDTAHGVGGESVVYFLARRMLRSAIVQAVGASPEIELTGPGATRLELRWRFPRDRFFHQRLFCWWSLCQRFFG